MDRTHYQEMKRIWESLEKKGVFQNRDIFLFGHCDATLEVLSLFQNNGYCPKAILDNSPMKQGLFCQGIPVLPPEAVRSESIVPAAVCIASRFYEAMKRQLLELGFAGEIWKLAEYNTYSEYSLSTKTRTEKYRRMEQGAAQIKRLEQLYGNTFRIFCPFPGLGDIYFCMSYLPHFLKKRNEERCVVCVVGTACARVVSLFGEYPVEVFQQAEMEVMVQAALYIRDKHSFIAHQDRPYVINLAKALRIKKIPLDAIYRSGVFGLSSECEPKKPARWKTYPNLEQITDKRAVLLSPYAKSVPALPEELWNEIIVWYRDQGYQLFTNVAEGEEPLEGTRAIQLDITELRSFVERAGTFIGIRSGLCDVLRTARCRKIALYPDYYYCDTKWKAIDMYSLEEFENILAADGVHWPNLIQETSL